LRNDKMSEEYLSTKQFPHHRSRNRHGMRGENRNLPQRALWLVKHAKLAQHRAAVVVDALACQPVVLVECVHPAERNLNAPSGCRETAPRAQMRAANDDFNDDRIVGDVSMLDDDLKVRKRFHQARVKRADAVFAFVVFSPGLIVILRGIAEGGDNAFEVVCVFEADVLFDKGDAGCTSLFWGGYGCHEASAWIEASASIGGRGRRR